MANTDQIVQELTARCGRLREEHVERLPSERTLSRELHASRSTVRRALQILVEDGLVNVIRGRNGGAYLVEGAHPERIHPVIHGCNLNRRLTEIVGYNDMLREQGIDVGNRVLALELEAPNERIAMDLEIDVADPVISLLRLRLADGAPLSLERMYLSLRRFPDLLDKGLGGEASMYEILQKRYNVTVAIIDEEIEIAKATHQAAHILNIQPNDPVLAIHRVARDATRCPVECSFDIFRGDRTCLSLRMTGPQQDSARPGSVAGVRAKSVSFQDGS